MNKYYQVKTGQLILMAILTGVFAGGLVSINSSVKEYLQLPEVTMLDSKCVSVLNYKNGEAYTCGDVGTILRQYRVKKN
jgi:hypothetical protein